MSASAPSKLRYSIESMWAVGRLGRRPNSAVLLNLCGLQAAWRSAWAAGRLGRRSNTAILLNLCGLQAAWRSAWGRVAGDDMPSDSTHDSGCQQYHATMFARLESLDTMLIESPCCAKFGH